MSHVQEQVPVVEVRSPVSWKVWLLALVVTGGAAAFVTYSVAFVWFIECWPLYWARTLPSILLVPVTIIGALVPVVLIVKRRRFVGLSPSQQWRALAALALLQPVAYVSGTLALAEAARNSRPVISFIPTLTIRYQPDHPSPDQHVWVHCDTLIFLQGGGSWQGTEFVFKGNYHERGWRGSVEDQGPDLNLTATMSPWQDGRKQIALDLDAKKTFLLQVKGLTDVQITRDGEAVSDQTTFGPGKYQVVITGSPK